MGCAFCATGQMGFKRDLSADEIFEQAALFSGELTRKEERLSNVVFMGMGEPFRNYDNVFEAATRIVKTLGVGARHVTISTVGVAPAVRRFADDCVAHELQLSLAISLHAASDAARGAIMPVNRRRAPARPRPDLGSHTIAAGASPGPRRATHRPALLAP